MNQCDKILEYLRSHPSITSAEAEERFACRRLAARINDLKAADYPIQKKTVSGKNRFGEPVHYASYSLINKEENNDQ